tara:strand:- start:23365 stop:24477 length:1113 start_codon:yes stop_codon:yes gene_type:complete
MEINVYNSFSFELKKMWVEFESIALKTPFQSYAWLSNWQKIIGKKLFNIKPQIAVVKKDQTIICIMPFGLRKVKGINVIEWLGGINSDYMCPLIHPEWTSYSGDFQSMWEEVTKRLFNFDIIHLYKQPSRIKNIDNPFVDFISPKIQDNISYKITLEESWDNYYTNHIKNKLRADSRRNRRNLNKIDKLKFYIPESEKEKEKIINSMIKQKSYRFRKTGEWDMLSKDEYSQFYRLLSKSSKEMKIHCSALILGEQIIATHVGLIDKDTFFYLMPAHEESYNKFSSGRLLLENLIEWSIINKLKYFDFTIGDEKYKKIWSNTEMKLFSYIKSQNFKGAIYQNNLNIKNNLKNIPLIGSGLRNLNSWIKNNI